MPEPRRSTIRPQLRPRTFEQIRAKDPDLNQPLCHMLDLKVEPVLEAAEALYEESRPLFASAKRPPRKKTAAQ